MKKIIISSLASAVMVMSAPLFASDVALNEYTGNYADINLGTNLYYGIGITSNGSSSTAGVLGMGWSAAVGHYITPRFGLEAGFMQNYLHANINNRNNTHINVAYGTTRFNVPIGDRVSFIGKLGLGYAFANAGALIPYTGVGLSYAVNDKIDITTQYQGLIVGIAGAGLLSVGLSYHF